MVHSAANLQPRLSSPFDHHYFDDIMVIVGKIVESIIATATIAAIIA